jgi:hypothetical protein
LGRRRRLRFRKRIGSGKKTQRFRGFSLTLALTLTWQFSK